MQKFAATGLTLSRSALGLDLQSHFPHIQIALCAVSRVSKWKCQEVKMEILIRFTLDFHSSLVSRFSSLFSSSSLTNTHILNSFTAACEPTLEDEIDQKVYFQMTSHECSMNAGSSRVCCMVLTEFISIEIGTLKHFPIPIFNAAAFSSHHFDHIIIT